MKKLFLSILFAMILASPLFAANGNGVALQDSTGNAITNANPLQVHCVSGCNSGGPGLWEANNVGIDTFSVVGIGSTNPGSALDVNGTVTANAFAGRTNGDVILNPTANNVGIGTSTTTSLLTIKGRAEMTAFKLTTSPTNGYALISDASGNGTWGVAGAAPGGSIPNLQYQVNSTTLGGITNSGSDGTNVGMGTVTPTSTLTIQKNSTTDMLRIDSSNQGGGNVFLVNNAGNVSIGSTNPAQKLDVSGTVRMTGLQVNSASTNFSVVGANVGIGTVNSAINLLDVAGGVSIGTTNATYNTAPSNGLLVQGNVGIGSTNPGVALDLGTGAIRIGIGTVTAGTILCVKSISNSRATVGYCTSTLTGDICATCN